MPLALKIVAQKHSTGCGIAVVATVARTSYEQVLKITSKFHKNDVFDLGLTDVEIIYTLRRLGLRARLHNDWNHRKPAILLFDWYPGQSDSETHAMVWDPAFGGRFLDPSGRAYDVDWQRNLKLWKRSGKETIEIR